MLPPKNRPAMPESVLEAVVGTAAGLGLSSGGDEGILWWGAAMVWWVGYEGLMRPGEYAKLTRGKIALPNDLLDKGVLPTAVYA